MICINSQNRDPFFNLALEEYLLKNEEQDVFMLWQSIPAVVVGKHQNVLAEINLRFVREHGIQLARRLSGGGAVFHGPGNLNFTWIWKGETGKLVDFSRFVQPVIQFLDTLGIKAEQGRGNEILVNGKKISGNAEHVYKNRVLHHGTMLFNADLGQLRESLRVIPGRYVDKAVQSKRSQVTNLAEYLPEAMDMDEFGSLFLHYIMVRFKGIEYNPDDESLKDVHELSKLKYQAWEWVYGWSPDYEFRGKVRFQEGNIRIYLKVHRGYIVDCTLESEEFPEIALGRLRDRLIASRHETDEMMVRLRESDITGCISLNCLQEAVYEFI
jgi:lipoate-protein ligase A